MGRYTYRDQNDADELEVLREISAIRCEDPSLTVQSAPDSDINELMRRFGIRDGSILPGQLGMAYDEKYYGDFSDMPADLHEAMERTRHLDDTFMTLPASVRAKFNNSALTMSMWLADPKNRPEAEEIGLVNRRPAPPTGIQQDPTGGSPPNPPTD